MIIESNNIKFDLGFSISVCSILFYCILWNYWSEADLPYKTDPSPQLVREALVRTRSQFLEGLDSEIPKGEKFI